MLYYFDRFKHGLQLVLIALGYSEYEYEDGLDADFLPIQFIGRSDISEFDQFSQEFQLLYSGDRLSGVAGIYYLDGSASGDFDVILSGLGLTIYQAGDQTKEKISLEQAKIKSEITLEKMKLEMAHELALAQLNAVPNAPPNPPSNNIEGPKLHLYCKG